MTISAHPESGTLFAFHAIELPFSTSVSNLPQQLKENHLLEGFLFFLIEGVQSWPTKKMSTRSKVSLASSSSSYIAPYRRGGKVLGRSEPELPDQIDSQSGSAPNSYCFIVSPFDLVLSIVSSSANGEKPSLCESVSVQGAEF